MRALGIDGGEIFEILGFEGALRPCQEVTLAVRGKDAARQLIVVLRADTGVELEYLPHGGIKQYVLGGLLAAA